MSVCGLLSPAALAPPVLTARPCSLLNPPPAAYAVTLLGLAPLRPPPSPRVALTALLPVSASFAASLFLGNYAYLGLSGECSAGGCAPAKQAWAGLGIDWLGAAKQQSAARPCSRRLQLMAGWPAPALPSGPVVSPALAPPAQLTLPWPNPAVAFVNICKAATPLATLAVGLAARLEPRSKLTLLATLLIAGGTALATAAEASTGA